MKKVKLKVNDFSDSKVRLVTENFGLTEISAKILLNRGLESIDDINNFLYPDFKYFESSYNFKDIDKGCKRIIQAIENKEKILIYGDYDVDGATSISQFVIYLKKAGADVVYYVPERESEGYGISDDFLNKIDKMQIELLITVDCGISETNAIEKINSIGIETILLDHHQCGDIIPNAYAVINPKQKDCPSKNKNLCAAGLSYKFLLHLNTYLKIDDVEDILLELACLGTIADIVELVEDNRIITYNGLKKINNTRLIGLKKLMELAGLGNKQIDAFHIGYIIAPRINAAGRMSSARIAVELLLATDEAKAKSLAEELEKLNVERKQSEQIIFNEANEKIEKDFLYKKNIIVVAGEGWHEGVLGIVASRITEKYDKPSIVVSIKDGIGKASARSLDYLNIYEALCSVSHLLEKFGGHKLAAGLTLKKSDINDFANEINKYVDKTIDKAKIQKIVNVDSYLYIDDITTSLYNEICRFEPFGHGNPKPTFALKKFEIVDIKRVGKDGKHLSFNVKDGKSFIKAVGFDKINLLEKMLMNPLSLVVNIIDNEFRGNYSLQLILQDIEDFPYIKRDNDINKVKVVNAAINKTKSKIIRTDIFELSQKLSSMYRIDITASDIICILNSDINVEYILKNEILYIKK